MKPKAKDIREIVAPFKGDRGVTIPVLQAIQNVYGYLPPETFSIIEDELGIPSSVSYGVATFYSQFRLRPVGKHIIKACDGTACHVRGSQTLLSSIKDHLDLKDPESSNDGLFTLEIVACLGCCSLAPVMMIDDVTYGNLTIEKMKEIIMTYRKGGG